jgi:hypothetical protein
VRGVGSLRWVEGLEGEHGSVRWQRVCVSLCEGSGHVCIVVRGHGIRRRGGVTGALSHLLLLLQTCWWPWPLRLAWQPTGASATATPA